MFSRFCVIYAIVMFAVFLIGSNGREARYAEPRKKANNERASLSRCLLRRVSSVCSSLSFVTRVTVSVLILSIPFRQRTGLCSPKHRGSDS